MRFYVEKKVRDGGGSFLARDKKFKVNKIFHQDFRKEKCGES